VLVDDIPFPLRLVVNTQNQFGPHKRPQDVTAEFAKEHNITTFKDRDDRLLLRADLVFEEIAANANRFQSLLAHRVVVERIPLPSNKVTVDDEAEKECKTSMTSLLGARAFTCVLGGDEELCVVIASHTISDLNNHHSIAQAHQLPTVEQLHHREGHAAGLH
jgi:hypothetical protein